jgi:hypothetical protein
MDMYGKSKIALINNFLLSKKYSPLFSTLLTLKGHIDKSSFYNSSITITSSNCNRLHPQKTTKTFI